WCSHQRGGLCLGRSVPGPACPAAAHRVSGGFRRTCVASVTGYDRGHLGTTQVGTASQQRIDWNSLLLLCDSSLRGRRWRGYTERGYLPGPRGTSSTTPKPSPCSTTASTCPRTGPPTLAAGGSVVWYADFFVSPLCHGRDPSHPCGCTNRKPF